MYAMLTLLNSGVLLYYYSMNHFMSHICTAVATANGLLEGGKPNQYVAHFDTQS